MKFNFRFRTKKEIVNHEGAQAFTMTPKMELYAAVVTSGLSDQFYEKSRTRIRRIRHLMKQAGPLFVAKLAIYAREQMQLRSIPLVLVVELAKEHQGDNLVKKTTERVVLRADEITELLAYYAQANNRESFKQLNKMSKQLQKGLGSAFNRFDEYQFAKYNRDAVISLKDALFLVHPMAKDDAQQMLFNKIAQDELETAYTWETELSALGKLRYVNDDVRREAFTEKWEELIFSNRLGYMATLRNLRNMLEANVSIDAIDKVCTYLRNERAIEKSRQLPFRFLSAYRELKLVKSGYVNKVLDALEDAVGYTAGNIAGYSVNTRVLIAADVSGSMQKPVSANSKVQLYDVGLMLAMLLQNRCSNVVTGMFGEKWKVIQVPRQNILANVMEYHAREGEVGYSTNGYLVIKDLLMRRCIVDKVMIFTDCQLWNSNNDKDSIGELWMDYKRIAPGARLYLFDLAGYGTTPLQVKDNDVYLMAGWNDKVFNVLAALEDGQRALKCIDTISI